MKAWLYLFIAGILEVAWAVGMKYSEGWTKLWPSVFTGVSMLLGLYFLSVAMKQLPLGTAYAVWTGIGSIGTVIYGMLFFKEPTDYFRILFILMILGGIVGLFMTNKSA